MPQYTKEQVIQALHNAKGLVFVAAKTLGCTPQTVYNHIKKSPDVRAAIDAERGQSLDVAELALMKAVQGGESWAVQFFLRTLGRDRGFGDKLEIDVRYVALVKQIEALSSERGISASDLFNDLITTLREDSVLADEGQRPGQAERGGG